jgi:hypothetical protein
VAAVGRTRGEKRTLRRVTLRFVRAAPPRFGSPFTQSCHSCESLTLYLKVGDLVAAFESAGRLRINKYHAIERTAPLEWLSPLVGTHDAGRLRSRSSPPRRHRPVHLR